MYKAKLSKGINDGKTFGSNINNTDNTYLLYTTYFILTYCHCFLNIQANLLRDNISSLMPSKILLVPIILRP